MVHRIIVQSPAVAQLIPTFIVVRCSVCATHRILIGRTIVITHTASFMGAVSFAHSKRWAVNAKAWIYVWYIFRKLLEVYSIEHNVQQTAKFYIFHLKNVGMGSAKWNMRRRSLGWAFMSLIWKEGAAKSLLSPKLISACLRVRWNIDWV